MYSWENDLAAYADTQMLTRGKVVLASETDLQDDIWQIMGTTRIQRVASFRQIQGISNQLRTLTNGRIASIDDMKLPPSVHIAPTDAHETRVVRRGITSDAAFVVDTTANTFKQVLPDDLDDVPLLTCGIDQGSIGCADHSFADSMLIVMFPHFCRIHRLIRDIKLSFLHCCGGIFLKASVCSSYIWGVNAKPFNTGIFRDQKETLLHTFLSTHDRSCQAFQTHGPAIAKDFGMEFRTDEDQEAVWDEIPHRLRSFTKKLQMPKAGRWFSWNGACEEQAHEFHAAKMIYQASTDLDTETANELIAFDDLSAAATAKTPAAELAKLKSACGGLSLCCKLMSPVLLELCKIMYVVTKGFNVFS